MIKLDFTKFKPQQGKLLLSEPFMSDPNFKRSVILLASHNEEGSVGFVLNQPMPARPEGGEINLEQIVEEFKGCKLPVYDGGPVQRDSLFYVHTLGDAVPDSIPIIDGLFWSGNFETIKALIKGNKISENEIRLFVGYSGWEAKQLENEIQQNSWLVAPATVELVMSPVGYKSNGVSSGKSSDEKFWNQVVKSMGKDYSVLANFPENPLWN